MEGEVISMNLRRLRSAKRLTQGELAERAGISRVAYSKIEKGESIPRVATLRALGKALGVPPRDLLAPARKLECVRFRARRKLPSREQVIQSTARWLGEYGELEESLNLRREYRLRDAGEWRRSEGGQVAWPIEAARLVRERLRIAGDEPIRDICGLLNSAGVKVYPMSLATEGFFGMSVGECDHGPAVVVNVWNRIPVERWIFTAAHELGHLVMHIGAYNVNETKENPEEEVEANLFASHFLMPSGVFGREWEDTWGLAFVDRVLKVKRIFKVSYKTVLYRLLETGRADSSVWRRFQTSYFQMYGKRLGWKDEPRPISGEDFQASYSEEKRSLEPANLTEADFKEDRLWRLVRLAIEKDLISVSRGAEILRISTSAMRQIASEWMD